MVVGLILLPLVAALAAFATPSNRLRPWILPVACTLHLILTLVTLGVPTPLPPGGWLGLDAPGKLVLGLTSVIFCLSSFYAAAYLRTRLARSNRVFIGCILIMLAMIAAVCASRNLGLMWVSMEATTIAAAPLIYFNHNKRSIEGTWKYLLICSVGIALSLLGSFFLAYASLKQGLAPSLHLDDLYREAPNLSPPWLHAAFALLLVGYGTKMGLAPMHTWKPDAYGEAPGVVGGLLSGALTSCAFLGVLRVSRIAIAGGSESPRQMLIALGLTSMLAGAVFVVRQRDFKRMLAYSSVEHMGILAIGIGLGSKAWYGALFHLVNNGLAKVLLFLTAGNIHRAYGSKLTDIVSGAGKKLPVSGWLFLLGLLAATGSPPFSPFRSLFAIISAAIGDGRWLIALSMLSCMLLVFLGMGKTVLSVVQGAPPQESTMTGYGDEPLTAAPMIILFSLLVLLGVYMPEPLEKLLKEAAAYMGA